jgi:hypothetical protein
VLDGFVVGCTLGCDLALPPARKRKLRQATQQPQAALSLGLPFCDNTLLRQLHDIHRNPPRLIFGEQLCCREVETSIHRTDDQIVWFVTTLLQRYGAFLPKMHAA